MDAPVDKPVDNLPDWLKPVPPKDRPLTYNQRTVVKVLQEAVKHGVYELSPSVIFRGAQAIQYEGTKDSIAQVLYGLRDKGIIEQVGRGAWRLTEDWETPEAQHDVL